MNYIFLFIDSLVNSWEFINDNLVVGDTIAGILAGIVLYLIFNRIIIKRPKVRLYVEPNPLSINDKNEFKIKFYLNNKSNSAAKNLRLLLIFNNLEILRSTRSKDGKEFPRLDLMGLNDRPAIQFDHDIFFNYPDKTNTYIGDAIFKIKNLNENISIDYEIVAENMTFFKDNLKLINK